MKKFEKEFRVEMPETIGETDKEFDIIGWINKNKKLPKENQICNIKIEGIICFENGEQAKTKIIKNIKYIKDGQWVKDGQVYGNNVFAWK